jgi:hypothetical protein
LDVLDVARNQKVGEYVDKINSRLLRARGEKASLSSGHKRVHSHEEPFEPRKKNHLFRKR